MAIIWDSLVDIKSLLTISTFLVTASRTVSPLVYAVDDIFFHRFQTPNSHNAINLLHLFNEFLILITCEIWYVFDIMRKNCDWMPTHFKVT